MYMQKIFSLNRSVTCKKGVKPYFVLPLSLHDKQIAFVSHIALRIPVKT